MLNRERVRTFVAVYLAYVRVFVFVPCRRDLTNASLCKRTSDPRQMIYVSMHLFHVIRSSKYCIYMMNIYSRQQKPTLSTSGSASGTGKAAAAPAIARTAKRREDGYARLGSTAPLTLTGSKQSTALFFFRRSENQIQKFAGPAGTKNNGEFRRPSLEEEG